MAEVVAKSATESGLGPPGYLAAERSNAKQPGRLLSLGPSCG
jgi:hypothetical protein